MNRCLKCKNPADVQLHGAGPHWPAGIRLDLCADHATLALARGEAVIRDPGAGLLPDLVPVSLGVRIGDVAAATFGFLFVVLIGAAMVYFA